MDVTVGTFNLNNLFSRFNFQAEIDAIVEGDTEVELGVTYDFSDPTKYRLRTFQGKLVKAKPAAERRTIADRILAMDVDVLAVQEVEDVGTLRRFAAEELDGRYPYRILVEGNDPRLIDVGVLSKLPLGGITSWQAAVFEPDPVRPIFSRDFLQVDVLDPGRTRRLFTVFNTHLKSHFVPFGEESSMAHALANEVRRRQAATAASIVKAVTRPDSAYVIVGDMNDPPDSEWMAPLVGDAELGLVNGLADPTETRPAKPDAPPPPSPAWTHRFKESGQPARYELYDHVWLSPSLATKQAGAWIDRRTKHGGDGSDHDPAWVKLSI
ncbi:MAG: endonuclease/exonuclease/phosphatase family protein [Actinobacteria bacterium]|nr:endonuclease/exonuclease/phosphatase family protein [Actinomycetota bacterium]